MASAHTRSPAPIIRRRLPLIGLLMILGGLYLLYSAALSPGLVCSRGAGQADCSLKNTLLGWLPLQQTDLRALQWARVGEACDRRGCNYRVELEHAGGSTPFTAAYTPDRAPKDELVRQIESYLRDPTAPPLAVWQTSGMMELAMPLVLIAAGMLLLPPRPVRAEPGGKLSQTVDS